jgi:hypothetical protein
MSFGRFNKNRDSKFGKIAEDKTLFDTDSIIKEAVPIWEILNITEEQYNSQYNTPTIPTEPIVPPSSTDGVIESKTE